MLGGLLVLGVPAVRSRLAEEAAVAVGLLLIAGSAFLLSPETPFPGLAAVPACLGTALVIWSGGRADAAAPLRLAPMVWLGLVSYSLYLWHWPLLVFARLLKAGCLSADSRLPLARIGPTQAELDRVVARHPGVAMFRPAASLCHDGRCYAGAGGTPLYFDDDHLAASGAIRLVPAWLDRVFRDDDAPMRAGSQHGN